MFWKKKQGRIFISYRRSDARGVAGRLSGTLGALFFFTILISLGSSEEPIITFFGSVLVVTLMFAFMKMSGFKTK